MSLFTIFHSRDFTATDPGWHPPGYCICSRFTSPEMVNEEERDKEANGAQFFTRSFCCSSYCSNSPHFQMSPAVAFLFPSLLRNTSITATGPRGTGWRIRQISAELFWWPLRRDQGTVPAPKLPSARPVPGARRSAPGDALLEAAGAELFLIV